MIPRATKLFFFLLALFILSGMALAEVPAKDLEEVRLSIEKSALPGERKAALFTKASDAIHSGIPGADVAIIVKRGIAKGMDARTLEESLDLAVRTKEKGLPVRPVLDRIQQGLSKGVSPERITTATKQLVEKLAAADTIVNNLERSGIKADKQTEKGGAVHTVARALERSVPEETITKMGLKAAKQGASLSRFDASVSSMTSFVEMGMPVDNASKLINKAIDKGYSEKDMIMMEREMSVRLRDGSKMEDVMKSMDSMMSSRNMGDWGKGMDGAPMQRPGSGMGSGSPFKNTSGMGSHPGTGGPGMGMRGH